MSEVKYMLLLSAALVGTGFFFLYVQHVRSIFEARTNISHLSQLERESMLKNDEALYYSFYKTIIEQPNFARGYQKLQNLSGIEYPRQLNVLQNFYVLPELAIGYTYHLLRSYSNNALLPFLSCWRSNDIRLDQRCDLHGQAMQFYYECVWLLGGVTLLIMFMYGTLMSESTFGGTYAVVSYITFHSFASKIYVRPMARENFAFPFIFMQMFYLCLSIQRVTQRQNYRWDFLMICKLTALTTISLMCWQFSSIIFATQIIIMTTPWVLNITPLAVSIRFTLSYSISQLLAILLAYYFSMGNATFLYSWMLGPAVCCLIICLARHIKSLPLMGHSCEISTKTICMDILFAISTQKTLSDAMEQFGVVKPSQNTFMLYRDLMLHWILQAKINFTTSLAACNPDYERMNLSELWDLVVTMIIKPYCMYGVVMLAKFFRKWRKCTEVKKPSNDHIERAKNYVLEDFMEENHISMQDMSNKQTEDELNECLKLLEKCDYDYEKYKSEKRNQKEDKSEAKEDFINQLKDLKEQINNKKQRERQEREIGKEKELVQTADPNVMQTENKDYENIVFKIDNIKSSVKTNTTTFVSSKDNDLKNEQTNGTSNSRRSAKPMNKPNLKRSANLKSNHNSSNSSPLPRPPSPSSCNLGAAAAAAENGLCPQTDIFSFHYIYSAVQMAMFTIFGLSVRKLFFLTFTQGCIIVPMCARMYYRRQYNVFWSVSLAVLMVSLLSPGITNIQEEYYPTVSTKGNEDLDSMLEWIAMNTEKDAVIAGPIDIIGTVHLTTRRNIVNHAHLELRKLNERTEHVYSVFSRQQSSDIYNQYSQLKIQYLIVSLKDCSNEIKTECDLLQIWDDMQPAYRKYPQFCSELANKNIPSFLKVFANDHYGIVKMFSQSVQLNLKYNKMAEKAM